MADQVKEGRKVSLWLSPTQSREQISPDLLSGLVAGQHYVLLKKYRKNTHPSCTHPTLSAAVLSGTDHTTLLSVRVTAGPDSLSSGPHFLWVDNFVLCTCLLCTNEQVSTLHDQSLPPNRSPFLKWHYHCWSVGVPLGLVSRHFGAKIISS